MLREALDFIRLNYLSETVIKHPDRAEATRVATFAYASEAICRTNRTFDQEKTHGLIVDSQTDARIGPGHPESRTADRPS